MTKVPPFTKGQIVERNRDGVRYKVLREYVPPKPGYIDVHAFELVRISPPEPFQQAAVCAEDYSVISHD